MAYLGSIMAQPESKLYQAQLQLAAADVINLDDFNFALCQKTTSHITFHIMAEFRPDEMCDRSLICRYSDQAFIELLDYLFSETNSFTRQPILHSAEELRFLNTLYLAWFRRGSQDLVEGLEKRALGFVSPKYRKYIKMAEERLSPGR